MAKDLYLEMKENNKKGSHQIQIRLRPRDYERYKSDAERLGIRISALAYMALRGMRIKDRVPPSLVISIEKLEEDLNQLRDISDRFLIDGNENSFTEMKEIIKKTEEAIFHIEKIYIYPEGGRN